MTQFLTQISVAVVGSLRKVVSELPAYNHYAMEVLGKGRKQVGYDYETVALPLSYGG